MDWHPLPRLQMYAAGRDAAQCPPPLNVRRHARSGLILAATSAPVRRTFEGARTIPPLSDMPIWTGGGQSGFAGIRVPDPEVALLEARAHLEQDQRNRDRTYNTGSLATVVADNNDWFLYHHTTWPPEILGDRALS